MEDGLRIERRGTVRWHTHLSDFANMVKAFVGSNYLSVAFAFSQAGLAASLVGLVFIASLTDHCCHLIVKCKYKAIENVVKALREHRTLNGEDHNDPVEEEAYFSDVTQKLKRNVSYGDVGQLTLGKTGLYIVNACVLLTQFGFCVGYFILIGNTIFTMFPLNTCDVVRNSTNDSDFRITNCRENHPIKQLGSVYCVPTQANYSKRAVISSLDSNYTETAEPDILHNLTLTSFSKEVYRTTAPDLRLIVLFPLPIFIFFSYIRHIRHLGPISIAANISILVGCVSLLVFLIDGFCVNSLYVLLDVNGLPVFFGLIAGAFEGIGTVVPIESSMEGNRHNFSAFLHGAIGVLSFVLTSFGVLGYLRFGTGVRQMLNGNLPTGSEFSLVVNICLCVGVILTFPLMMYPVLELTETYLFGDGRLCGPKKKMLYDHDDEDEDEVTSDRDALLPATNSSANISLPVATSISPSVSGIKRNILRTSLVLIAAGLAVVFRNSFAYILAFVGAIGSTLLAYILPCVFHLKLRWNEMSVFLKIKDIFIIVVGSFCGLISVYSSVRKIIENS